MDQTVPFFLLARLFAMLAWPWAAMAAVPGTNPITNPGFEALDAGGRPVDWAILGKGRVVDVGRDGSKCALLEGQPDKETGLNRRMGPPGDRRGAMLDAMKGGIRFWYRVEAAPTDASLTMNAIAIGESGIEDTGESRAKFEIPAAFAGDGKWHMGLFAYDFTANPRARFVQVAPRAHGEGGKVLIDDVEWLPEVGPVPFVGHLAINEVKGSGGGECLVSAGVRNDGDRPMDEATLSLAMGRGAAIEGGPVRQVGRLRPGQVERVSWRVKGNRPEPGVLRVSVAAAGIESSAMLGYCPQLEIVSFLAEPFIVPNGGTTRLALRVRNRGNAELRGLRATMAGGKGLGVGAAKAAREVASLGAGCEAVLLWDATLGDDASSAVARVVVEATDAGRSELEAKLLVAPGAPEMAEDKSGVAAGVSSGVAWVGNGRVRMVCPEGEGGYGVGWVQWKGKSGWRTVGALPLLTRLVVTGDGGSARENFVRAKEAKVSANPKGKRAALELAGEVAGAKGVTWAVSAIVSVERDDDAIGIGVRASPSGASSFLAMDGPILYAGEGAGVGTRRLDAIFCGAEWLVEGEISSSDLDIAPDHPDRLRYAPHPHMVTLPVMCGRFAVPGEDPVLVSYSWEHRKPYLREHDRPVPLFASPDRFDGRAATAMGIFAPSMPEFIEPNLRVAHQAMEVGEGESVALAARIEVVSVGEGKTALEAVRRWCARNPLPEPSALPHGKTLEDEIAFSMGAYLGPLWKADEEKWFAFLGGPALGNVPSLNAGYLYDLRMALALCPASPVMEQVRARHDRAIALGAGRPSAMDKGFHLAGPAERLRRAAHGTLGTAGQQSAEGGWAFDARIETGGIFKGKDYALLGDDGAVEVGTCARKAWDLLSAARMTGAVDAQEAGLKALAFMERFEVPRAAQVWEVPVHTPDVLASADACQAYLEGYLLTGDKKYLERATYWAWTGVPFIYLWDADGFEFLRYASIPVFGATWFKGSWFARPVQWNGLRYAEALFQLAEHDRSLDWAKMARGLTVSAMHQQSTNAVDVALWPDSISAIDKKKSAWVFAPHQILSNVYRLLGLRPSPVTELVPSGAAHIRISAAGEIKGAELEGYELRFDVAHPRLPSAFVTVANVSRPAAVLVDGKEVKPWVGGALADESSGWAYADGEGLLELRVPGGSRKVKLHGVAWIADSVAPRIAREVAFGFQASAEGWVAEHHLEPIEVTGGILRAKTTGGDPYLVRRACQIPAAAVKQIRIRMAAGSDGSPAEASPASSRAAREAAGPPDRIPGGTPAPASAGAKPPAAVSGQFFFATDAGPEFSQERVVGFPLVPDGRFHDVVIAVGGHPDWRGTVTAIRIDPVAGGDGVPVQIDEIRGE